MESTQQENPSVQRAAGSTSGSRSQAELKAGDMHNIRAWLTKNKITRDCDEMIDYLQRSRIYTAITKACTAYASHQNEFWRTAEYDAETNGIRGLVQGKGVLVTAEILNELLELGDAVNDPISLNVCRVKGCLLRCGYSGEIRNETVHKTKFTPTYRYLMHVISHCLGPRRSGHDQLNQTFSHLFVALVLNVKFNISRVIFNCLKENLTKKEGQFLMYPRFLQMVIESQIEGLSKDDADRIKLRHMNDQTVRQMSRYIGTIPPKRALICHLANPEYKAPEKKYLWRNEGSTSQVENIEIVSDDEDEEAEVESHRLRDPTGGEQIPTGIDDITVDDLFSDDEEETSKRRKDKAVAEEPEKKKRKVYRYKPITGSVDLAVGPTTAAASAPPVAPTQATTQAAGSSRSDTQIPDIQVSETLRKLQSYMIDMIKEESARKSKLEEVERKAAEKDLQIEILLKKDEEKDRQIESLLKRDAEREQKMMDLEKRNERMEEILLDYTQEFKKLKAHVEEQNEEVLKLKQFAEGEQETGQYSGDEQG